MSRLTSRSALTALTLGLAALGGALVSGEAAAKGFHGGGWGKHHHGHFHGGYGFGLGFGYGGYAPAYVAVVDEEEPDFESCVVRRSVTPGGRIIVRKRCY
ncbi:MAG TPA: hypothetical protein VHL98_18875 [Microvirga sp.]|jgi:hypothetical protein|nr:hypothetical protein [Microvirga sp.]